MKDEIGSLWKEAIVVVFTLCYYFPGGNEENDENSQAA